MGKFFRKNEFENIKGREKYGIIACIVNILLNIFLFTLKLMIGLLSQSISIMADGFDNLVDSLLSVVIILGFKVANKPADEKHPFGYGRIEYIFTLLVSIFILLFGALFIKNSLMQILRPKPIKYSNIALISLIISILIKVFLVKFNGRIGEKIKSPLMKLNVLDCLTDILSTGATIISLTLSSFTEFPIDGFIGIIVSIFILYTGFKSAADSIDLLLGRNITFELMDEIKNILFSYKDISGIHNLVIHDYGPDKRWGSVHVEIVSDRNLSKIDELMDKIQNDIVKKLNLNINIHVDLTEQK